MKLSKFLKHLGKTSVSSERWLWKRVYGTQERMLIIIRVCMMGEKVRLPHEDKFDSSLSFPIIDRNHNFASTTCISTWKSSEKLGIPIVAAEAHTESSVPIVKLLVIWDRYRRQMRTGAYRACGSFGNFRHFDISGNCNLTLYIWARAHSS